MPTTCTILWASSLWLLCLQAWISPWPVGRYLMQKLYHALPTAPAAIAPELWLSCLCFSASPTVSLSQEVCGCCACVLQRLVSPGHRELQLSHHQVGRLRPIHLGAQVRAACCIGLEGCPALQHQPFPRQGGSLHGSRGPSWLVRGGADRRLIVVYNDNKIHSLCYMKTDLRGFSIQVSELK